MQRGDREAQQRKLEGDTNDIRDSVTILIVRLTYIMRKAPESAHLSFSPRLIRRRDLPNEPNTTTGMVEAGRRLTSGILALLLSISPAACQKISWPYSAPLMGFRFVPGKQEGR